MKRTVWIWQLMGFAVTSFLGTVLHFMYECLGEPFWIAPFSGVNESTWEHMKLLFWPMLLYAVFESLFFKSYANFWCVKLKGMLLGLTLIPVIFYTYNGVIGKSPDWVNIGIFFLSAAVAYIYESKRLKLGMTYCDPRRALAVLCVIALSFTVFTFNTPEIGIFRDPLNGSFGI